MLAAPGAVILAGLIRCYQRGRRVVVFDARISQEIAAGRARPELGIAQEQFLSPFIQLADGFRRRGCHIDGVAPGLQYGPKGQAGCKFAMHQKYTGQVQGPAGSAVTKRT